MSKPLGLIPANPVSDVAQSARAEVVSPDADSDERQLVEACRRGERPAMHAFYTGYRRRVFGLIARIVGAQEAEELTQDVFVRAFRGLHGFRGESRLSTWMYRLAVNAALSHAARTLNRQRRAVSEDELLALPALDDGTADADPRLRARLNQALAALPAGYRAVLTLHDIEGLQHDEIADILGCRVGTSKSQLHKARAKMRELLGDLS